MGYRFETLQLHVGQEQADVATEMCIRDSHQTAQKGFKNTRFDVKVTHTQMGNQSIAIVQTY